MKDGEKRICGAKNRQGEPCKRAPLAGKTRCLLHGGKTPKGGAGNPVHGMYTKRLTDEEKEAFDSLQLGNVDHALRMANILLMRSVNRHLELTANEPVTDLELVEKRIVDEDGTMTTLRRPDTLGIIDRYMGRVGHLEKVRAELIAAAAERGDGAGDKARDLIETIRAIEQVEQVDETLQGETDQDD